LIEQDWIVYAKPPSADQNMSFTIWPATLAISNHRLLSVSDSAVSFRWKDYAHGSKPRHDAFSTGVFCVVSYSMFYPEVFRASATSAELRRMD
jgi:hypothetical protein